MRPCVWYFMALAGAGYVAMAQPPDAVYRMAGVVVDAASGEPVKLARIAIASWEHIETETGALVTAADGRFNFEVPKGKYQITAQRNGLPPQSYGAQLLGSSFGIAIVVDSDHQPTFLTLRLFPPASISGKITDEVGEPVENALVQLLRATVVAGRRRVGTQGWAYTNDLGEYRFGRLAAGAYYIAVTAKPWYADTDMGLGASRLMAERKSLVQPQQAYAPVFYPNATDVREAAPLTIKPGQDAEASFSLRSVPGFNVIVHCEGKESARMLFSLSADGVMGVDSFQRVMDSYGSYASFPAVPLGRYTLRVNGLDSNQPFSASQTVEVSSSNVDVKIVSKNPTAVTGTIQVDGGAKVAGSLLIALRDEAANRGFSRSVSADGSFTFPNVSPGKYRVVVGGPAGFFAKEVTVEDGGLKDGLVEVDDFSRRLKIIASNGVGRVKGFVYRDGVPVEGVMVALTPTKQTSDPGFYLGFQTDSDGSFDFQNVRPGDYQLFAVDNLELEYTNAQAVKPYRAKAKVLRVEPRGSYSEKVEVQ